MHTSYVIVTKCYVLKYNISFDVVFQKHKWDYTMLLGCALLKLPTNYKLIKIIKIISHRLYYRLMVMM